MTRKLLLPLILAVLVVIGVFYVPNDTSELSAQTTAQETYLSAAVTLDQNFISVASETGFANGEFVFIDAEYMQIVDITDARGLRVIRGQGGTRTGTHPSGARVFQGPAQQFVTIDYFGDCTSTNQLYLPVLNIANARVYDCKESRWQWANFSANASLNSNWEIVADAAYTATIRDEFIYITHATAGRAITLPSITNIAGHKLCVINADIASGGGAAAIQTITITAVNGQLIGPDRAATLTTTGRGEMTCLVSTGMLGSITNVGWLTATAP